MMNSTRPRHVDRFVTAGLLVLLSASAAQAQMRRIDDPPIPLLGEAATHPPRRRATYLDNEITKNEQDYFVLRTAVELDAPPGRWFALDVEFRLSRAEPLVLPSGKVLVKRWNNLFTPHDPRPTRWLDCRLDVDFDELETAENFPKGKSFVLWAMGLVYNWEQRSYVGSGWDVRAPLLLTTDSNGTVIRCKTPRLLPLDLLELNPAWKQSISARKARLDLSHLQLREGGLAALVAREDGSSIPVLAAEETQAWQPQGYGGFFQPIDSPAKARELLELQMPGHVIIQSRGQYQAILEAIKAVGWAQERDILAEPPAIGETVTEIEGLGYRVSQLSIDPLPQARNDALGDIVYRDIYVTYDGRVGFAPVRCVRGPQLPPPDEKDTNWQQPAPSDPETYTQAIRGVLRNNEFRTLPNKFIATDETLKLPLPIEAPGDIVEARAPTVAAEPSPATQPAESRPAIQPTEPATTPEAPPATAEEATVEIVEPEQIDDASPPAAPESPDLPDSEPDIAEAPSEEAPPEKESPDAANDAPAGGRPQADALARLMGKNIADVRRQVVLVLPPAALDEDNGVRTDYSGEALCETLDDGLYVLDFHKGTLRGMQKQRDDED
jgi:hypothetical protein